MLEQVEHSLLSSAHLNQQKILNVFNLMDERAIDFGECFFQLSLEESWVLEDGIIKEGGFHIDKGVGVRALSGEKTAFAYADHIDLNQLQQCANAVKGIAQSASIQVAPKAFHQVKTPNYYAAFNPLETLDKQQKIELLRLVDKTARQESQYVTQVNAFLSAVYEEILVAGTDGTWAADIRPLVRLSVAVLVEKNGNREVGRSGVGGRYPLSVFLEEHNGETKAEHFAKEAVRQALTNINAKAAPSGTLPVILGAGWCGVLLHEAVGHGLEGDFNRKGTSVFTGKIGEQVTSPLCTVIDDGTLLNRRGSLNIDDEGTPAQRNVLIENGVLKGYLQDKHNARLMGVNPTGNGRRESYAHLPLPRMTNTYMQAGNSSLEEMIASVPYGVFATHFGGGQVDITSGKFTFSTSEAYLIENGKITSPIKGATLIGSGIDVMQKISMVGNKLEIDHGIGVCGKEGQSVPVGVGQPALKIDEITVGGTE